MSNITSISEGFEPFPEDEIVICERTSPEFLQAAYALGDYLKALPLSSVQHNTLIEHIKGQIEAAEREAFKTGVDLGIKIAKEAQ